MTSRSDSPVEPLEARRLLLSGRVQGLGVRPAIARLAAELGLAGSVSNSCQGVEVLIEGPRPAVEQFERRLADALPDGAVPDGCTSSVLPPSGAERFTIDRSAAVAPLAAEAPRDVAVCAECLDEVAAVGDRRHRYPLTSCTRCGPRFSIIERMPHERSHTSMSSFTMCAACQAEYESPADRRFHAQTNACARCGPQVWCADRSGRTIARGEGAVAAGAAALREGRIVAVRGVGGYLLLCDATNAAAVDRLRTLKRRRARPLAVLVESLAAAEKLAILNDAERRALVSPENPIVLVRARTTSGLASGVHPGLTEVGLMLPTTPLHWLLASACRRPLVATSGNLEGEPLAVEVADAERSLAALAELWLHHDRPILHAIDDSVVRVIAGRRVTLRNARGLAPLPLSLDALRPTLAVGGHQKNAVAISNGRQAVLGPHVGDLDRVGARRRFLDQIGELTRIYGTTPEAIAHDLHPDYFTSHWAQDEANQCIAVQHHHAHVAAGMLEHGWLDREVLGLALDGTGYGSDGTIWGGELLLATASDYRRVGSLWPFCLPGGEAAVREPWRVAVALVDQALGRDAAYRLTFDGASEIPTQRVAALIDRPGFSPATTSAGRLFDGVAALVLGATQVEFEGQAAMLLEAACDPLTQGTYELPLVEGALVQLDWRPLVRQLLADRARGETPGAMAMRFHRALASGFVSAARRFAPRPIVLAGGVFQNRLLVESIAEQHDAAAQPLGLPGLVPPNDGGLAAGQVAVAMARCNA